MGIMVNAGTYTTVKKTAVKVAKQTGTAVSEAIIDFKKANKQKDISHEGGFFKSLIKQIKNPRHAATELVEVKTVLGPDGRDTLAIKHGLNLSGYVVEGGTVPVKMPEVLTKKSVMTALNEAKTKAKAITNNNYKAVIINNPDLEIKRLK